MEHAVVLYSRALLLLVKHQGAADVAVLSLSRTGLFKSTMFCIRSDPFSFSENVLSRVMVS